MFNIPENASLEQKKEYEKLYYEAVRRLNEIRENEKPSKTEDGWIMDVNQKEWAGFQKWLRAELERIKNIEKSAGFLP